MLPHEENCTSRVWSLIVILIKSISGEVSPSQKQGPRRTVKYSMGWIKHLPLMMETRPLTSMVKLLIVWKGLSRT